MISLMIVFRNHRDTGLNRVTENNEKKRRMLCLSGVNPSSINISQTAAAKPQDINKMLMLGVDPPTPSRSPCKPPINNITKAAHTACHKHGSGKWQTEERQLLGLRPSGFVPASGAVIKGEHLAQAHHLSLGRPF